MKTTTQKLTGEALRSAAIREAKTTGYAVVIRISETTARRYEPSGSYSDGPIGSYRFCVNR